MIYEYVLKNTTMHINIYVYSISIILLLVFYIFWKTSNYSVISSTLFIARSNFALLHQCVFCDNLLAREIILIVRWIQMSRTFDYFQVCGSSSIIQWRVYSLAKIDYVACLGLNRRGDTKHFCHQSEERKRTLCKEVSISISALKHSLEIRIKLYDLRCVGNERGSLSAYRTCRVYISSG